MHQLGTKCRSRGGRTKSCATRGHLSHVPPSPEGLLEPDGGPQTCRHVAQSQSRPSSGSVFAECRLWGPPRPGTASPACAVVWSPEKPRLGQGNSSDRSFRTLRGYLALSFQLLKCPRLVVTFTPYYSSCQDSPVASLGPESSAAWDARDAAAPAARGGTAGSRAAAAARADARCGHGARAPSSGAFRAQQRGCRRREQLEPRALGI